MSEVVLGRFGDRRLEKGGPICTPVWLRAVGGACVCVGWAGIGPARSA